MPSHQASPSKTALSGEVQANVIVIHFQVPRRYRPSFLPSRIHIQGVVVQLRDLATSAHCRKCSRTSRIESYSIVKVFASGPWHLDSSLLGSWHTDERERCYKTESGTFLILLGGNSRPKRTPRSLWRCWVMGKREIGKKRSECDLVTSKEKVWDAEILMGLGSEFNPFSWQRRQIDVMCQLTLISIISLLSVFNEPSYIYD